MSDLEIELSEEADLEAGVDEADPEGAPAVPVHLRLTHCIPRDPELRKKPRKPVLLLHGASANSASFTIPSVRSDGRPSLAEWLVGDFDPWLLDWRGSSRVVADERNSDFLTKRADAFNYNAAAQFDILPALKRIRERLKMEADAARNPWIEKPFAAFGHCMGSTILAEAVALRHIKKADVDCVVLSALGLFYEVPIDGRIKSEERILEQLSTESFGDQLCCTIDPRVKRTTDGYAQSASWPKTMDNLYQSWPARLKSHMQRPTPLTDPDQALTREQLIENAREMCNRVSFMYGAPYREDNLIDAVHGAAGAVPALPDQFGAIPLHMYIHAARNIRKGRATHYPREQSRSKVSKRNDEMLSDKAHCRFLGMKKVTLITGALNRLWHRDSIDRMYEWLRRGPVRPSCACSKHVFGGYAHQDLLWGKHSARDVFPTIRAGLD